MVGGSKSKPAVPHTHIGSEKNRKKKQEEAAASTEPKSRTDACMTMTGAQRPSSSC
jgi:hypothetical protein